jgi:hypothetical protein
MGSSKRDIEMKKEEKPKEDPGVCDIVSPPYPRDNETVDSMYDKIRALMGWLEYYREGSNNYHGKKDCIAKPRTMATLDTHRKMPLRRFHIVFMQMRHLRVNWDSLVANYEEDWNCGRSQDVRHGLLHFGQSIADAVYLSDEMLEARADTHERECMKAMLRNTRKLLMSIDMDPYHDEEEDNDGGNDSDPMEDDDTTPTS